MNQRKAGAILSYISVITDAVVGFFFVPILISFLGKDQFGLYQLVGSFIAYLGLMDFGLSNTATRYYSRYLAQGDGRAQENFLAVCGIMYLIIPLLVILVGVGSLPFIIPFYQNTLSPADILTAKYMFYILLANVAVVLPANIFYAVINGHQKFMFSKSITLITVFFRPVSVVLFLCLKNSVMTVVVVQTVFNILMSVAAAYYALYVLKAKFKLHSFNKKYVFEILSFSVFIFLLSMMDIVYIKTGHLILGAVMGTGAVAVYAVAVQIVMIYRYMSGAIYGVFLPYFSSEAAKGEDMTNINTAFLKTSRLQLIILGFIGSGFVVLGQEFLVIWVGKAFSQAYFCAVVLMAAYFFFSSHTSASLIVQAKSKHAPYAVIVLMCGLLNFALSVPMTKKFGLAGCVCTTAFCLLLGQAMSDIYFWFKVKIDIKGYIKNCAALLTLFAAVTAFAFGANTFFRTENIFLFLLKGVWFSGFFIGIMWVWSGFGFNAYEKNLIVTSAVKIFGFLKKKSAKMLKI